MILLLGGRGYVGSAFARRMNQRQISYRTVSRQDVDYTNPLQLTDLIKQTRPHFLINAAGYTGKPNVEACEANKEECLRANVELPADIRQVCESMSVPWGHVSSGCIYQGTRDDGLGYRESDPPNFCFQSMPCSFYSGSKALGEEQLQNASNVFVWRLRIPFSQRDGERNYLSKLMRYERLLDVRNSLADLDEFVEACLDCWQLQVPFGVYNVVNSGSITTREVVDLIKTHHRTNRAFQFFSDEDEFMRTAAKIPRSSCVLDNSKLLSVGCRMSEIHDAIKRALRNWEPE